MLLIIACSKEDEKQADFSNIYLTDEFGNDLSGNQTDGQWESKVFTANELALFSSLDTNDLSGTTKPATINSHPVYPNPFERYFSLSTTFNRGFSGSTVVKFVIVNTKMQAVQKGAIRLQPNQNGFAIQPAFPTGKYRIYYSFSALGDEHYYTSWGNLHKK
jgi:hypothetical protein